MATYTDDGYFLDPIDKTRGLVFGIFGSHDAMFVGFFPFCAL